MWKEDYIHTSLEKSIVPKIIKKLGFADALF